MNDASTPHTSRPTSAPGGKVRPALRCAVAAVVGAALFSCVGCGTTSRDRFEAMRDAPVERLAGSGRTLAETPRATVQDRHATARAEVEEALLRQVH